MKNNSGIIHRFRPSYAQQQYRTEAQKDDNRYRIYIRILYSVQWATIAYIIKTQNGNNSTYDVILMITNVPSTVVTFRKTIATNSSWHVTWVAVESLVGMIIVSVVVGMMISGTGGDCRINPTPHAPPLPH